MVKRYALNLAGDGRILSATYEQFAPKDAVFSGTLPDGDLSDYRYAEGTFVFDPLPKIKPPAFPQADTDALLVDHEYRLTLLELNLVEE